jgi:alkylation response protein AidB-like acyl-CoA dehydrogenase
MVKASVVKRIRLELGEPGFEQHRAWERKLSERGFSAVTWPAALGGRQFP